MGQQTIASTAPAPPGSRRRPVASLIIGGIVCIFAVAFVVGGTWALWKDRVERDDSGFVTIGTANLQTDTYAIVGDLHGDGPSWLWESDVMGDTRVRATSQSPQPLFIGVAHTDDLFRYLDGAGYATVDSFEVTADTTHEGPPPSGPPARKSIWAASTQGTGRQTLRWDSRAGDWSIVFMNANAGAGVGVDGTASAELPILPWVAGGLLVIGAALGFVGGLLLVKGSRARREPTTSPPAVEDLADEGGEMLSNKEILDRYVELYVERDLDGIMDLYAEDCVQAMPDGMFEGRRSIRERLARELDAFSDLEWGVVSFVDQDDAFCDEWYFVGNQTGPLLLPDGTVLPATGKRVELHGMEFVRVRDGKIVVDNLYYDNLTVVAQLGLMPQAVSTAT